MASSARLAIFPASGALGSATLKHLVTTCRIPPDALILAARAPQKQPVAWTHGAALHEASFESSLEHLQSCFAGAAALFLISYPDYNHEYRVRVHLAAIAAARAAGVTHVFYSSLAFAGATDHSKAVVMQAHLDTEQHLAALARADPAFSFTSIREGLYAESFAMYTGFPDLQAARPVAAHPHDGQPPGIAWADRDELGEASARILQRWFDGRDYFRNQTVLLSGPRVYSLAETIDVVSRVSGKPIDVAQTDVDAYCARAPVQQALGTDQERLRWWATSYDGVRAGECAIVSPHLAQLLGREPLNLEQALAQQGLAVP